MVSDALLCIVQHYKMLKEKTQCCFIGKGMLYKLLNTGVAIVVPQSFVKNNYLLIRISFALNKCISIKGWKFLGLKSR